MKTTLPSKFARLLASLSERGVVRRAGGEWRTRCPAHDDHGPSLYISLSLDRTCVLINCKSGCDSEDIVAALGKDLADLFLDDDTEVEVDDDFAIIDAAPVDPSSLPEPMPDDPAIGKGEDGVKPAGPDLCHQVYDALLGLLSVSEAHRQDLGRRGLDDADIDRAGYRSLERFALNQAVGQLKGRFDEATLLGVPGFRRDRGRVRFVDSDGLLVPVRDLQGRIIALKVRRDDGQSGPKYLWISSSDQGGPSPGSPPHVPLGVPARAPTIRLTEGELKSDLSWKLSGLPTIGVSGVSNWKNGLPVLTAMGVEIVHLAFDADATTKAGVARELAACARAIIDAGLEVHLERWDLADGKGIDDLLVAGKQPEIIAGQQVLATLARLTESTAESTAADEDDWVPADPTGTVESFPVVCLPTPVAHFVTEGARALQCPVDFVGTAVLAVAASAIGGSRKLRIRRGYEEGARLYLAIVAPPGSTKSAALRIACAPVYAQQQRRREDYRKDRDQYERDREAFEVAHRKALRSEDGLLDMPERPVKPVMGHSFVGDFTTEALAPILDRNPRGVLVIRDELTGWVLAMDQYRGGKGTDRQFFLSCWSGEPAKYDRKSDAGESLIVIDPVLSVVGCIPPGKLAELDAGNDGEDGFIHRLLFSSPDPMPHRRWSWQGIAPTTQQRWKAIVERLYALEMGQDEFDQPTAIVIELAPEACPLWETWYNEHAEEMESPDFPEVLIGPWSKLIAYAARLALIVHLLRKACGEEIGDDVDPESLRRALRLVAYFESHARAVYARLRQSEKTKSVQQAIAWIRAHGGECNPTDLARNNVAGIEKTSEAETLMKELEDRGYGRREKKKAGNNRHVTSFVAKPVQSGASRLKSGQVG